MKKLWQFVSKDSNLLVLGLFFGLITNKQGLIYFCCLGLLIIKYGHKKEQVG